MPSTNYYYYMEKKRQTLTLSWSFINGRDEPRTRSTRTSVQVSSTMVITGANYDVGTHFFLSCRKCLLKHFFFSKMSLLIIMS